MLSYLFWRPRNHKQHVNKKNNFELDSAASSGGQGKYMKYVSCPWRLLEAALSIFNVSLFLISTIFEMELIKIKEISIDTKS